MESSWWQRTREWWSRRPLSGFVSSVEQSLSRGRPWYWKLTLGCLAYSYLYYTYVIHR